MTNTPPPGTPVRNDAELFEVWQSLMGPGGFGVRSIWVIFLDADQRTLPVVVPIDDRPAEPDRLLVGNLAKIVGGLIQSGDAASAALLLSRPGPSHMLDPDRRWARVLHDALGTELSRWPIHLATQDRIQVFAPDDLIAVPA
ncbi:MAG: hypothetical protein ACRDWT_02885 [Jatrophihabitantaceae bacterium]